METNASKSVTSTQETEAFGRFIGGTGSTGNPFGGYHGAEGYRQDGDGPQGLEPYQKVGARYYDATFGRFLTRDTDLSQSPYAYCGGDPVNCTDPSGHEPTPPATFETTGSTGIVELSDGGLGCGGSSIFGDDSSSGSSTPSTPDGNGGQVTATPNSVTDTKGPDSITVTNPFGSGTTFTDTVHYPVAPGITAVGTESYTPGTGASNQSFGLNAIFGSGTLQVKVGSDGSYSAFGGFGFQF